MNKKYNNVIHIFFSDYLAWLLIVSSLFVVSCVLAIAFGKAQGFIWIIPVLFLVIYCFSLPLLILYRKTKKDIKNRNIEQITIKNFKIDQDDTFGFKNRGGAAVGKRKYKIIHMGLRKFLFLKHVNSNVFAKHLGNDYRAVSKLILLNERGKHTAGSKA